MTQLLCRALLFDLDGVLVDSTPAVTRVWTGWATERGLDPQEVVRRAHGRPSISTIRELLPNADLAAEDREVERRELADLADIVPLPGALELLAALPQTSWAIATSGTRPLATARIRAAGLPVPLHLVTASDVQRGKPHPDPYLKAAESLGISPSDCIVVEDAPAGVHAGRAAGARALALRTTASDPDLFAAGANWIIDNLASLAFENIPPSHQVALTFR